MSSEIGSDVGNQWRDQSRLPPSLEERGNRALYISTDNHQGGRLQLADLLRRTPETPSGGTAALFRNHCNLLKHIFKDTQSEGESIIYTPFKQEGSGGCAMR